MELEFLELLQDIKGLLWAILIINSAGVGAAFGRR